MESCINKGTVGGRKSNIEALRLLSMLMVLNLHSCWCFDIGTGWERGLDFFREATSICAVNVFLIISGYFGIKWKFKSFFNLIFQLFFYSFGLYLVVSALGIVNFTLLDLLKCAKATFGFWGFITGYVVLYFVSPLINAFVDKFSTRKILAYIAIFYLAVLFICVEEEHFLFFLMYLIGRYIRKADLVTKLKINAGRMYWLTTICVFFICYLLFLFTPLNTAALQDKIPIALNYRAPFVILQAVFLFLFFARLNFQNKIVNWLSASCLSIFLIHMHPAIKEIGYYTITKSLYSYPFCLHISILLLLVAGVFFGSILIDKVRIFVSDLIYKIIINKIYERISLFCLRRFM